MIATSAKDISGDPAARSSALLDALKKPLSELRDEASEAAYLDYTNDYICTPSRSQEEGFNGFYGNSSIYRLWLNRQNGKLFFSIPHGIDISDTIHSQDNLPGYRVIPSAYPSSERFFGSRRGIYAYPIIFSPPPLVILTYLRGVLAGKRGTSQAEIYWKQLADDSDGGNDSCVFFLSHSSTHVVSTPPLPKIRRYIEQLRKAYKKVFCVVYFRDTSHIHLLHDLFDGIFCCGHFMDPRFLARLHSIMLISRNIAYNQFGTHAFHAASLMRSVRHYQMEPSYVKSPDSKLSNLEFEQELSGFTDIKLSRFLVEMRRADGDIGSLLRMTLVPPEELGNSHRLLLSTTSLSWMVSTQLSRLIACSRIAFGRSQKALTTFLHRNSIIPCIPHW